MYPSTFQLAPWKGLPASSRLHDFIHDLHHMCLPCQWDMEKPMQSLSMYGIFTYILHLIKKNQPNTSRYIIHGLYGYGLCYIKKMMTKSPTEFHNEMMQASTASMAWERVRDSSWQPQRCGLRHQKYVDWYPRKTSDTFGKCQPYKAMNPSRPTNSNAYSKRLKGSAWFWSKRMVLGWGTRPK